MSASIQEQLELMSQMKRIMGQINGTKIEDDPPSKSKKDDLRMLSHEELMEMEKIEQRKNEALFNPQMHNPNKPDLSKDKRQFIPNYTTDDIAHTLFPMHLYNSKYIMRQYKLSIMKDNAWYQYYPTFTKGIYDFTSSKDHIYHTIDVTRYDTRVERTYLRTYLNEHLNTKKAAESIHSVMREIASSTDIFKLLKLHCLNDRKDIYKSMQGFYKGKKKYKILSRYVTEYIPLLHFYVIRALERLNCDVSKLMMTTFYNSKLSDAMYYEIDVRAQISYLMKYLLAEIKVQGTGIAECISHIPLQERTPALDFTDSLISDNLQDASNWSDIKTILYPYQPPVLINGCIAIAPTMPDIFKLLYFIAYSRRDTVLLFNIDNAYISLKNMNDLIDNITVQNITPKDKTMYKSSIDTLTYLTECFTYHWEQIFDINQTLYDIDNSFTLGYDVIPAYTVLI